MHLPHQHQEHVTVRYVRINQVGATQCHKLTIRHLHFHKLAHVHPQLLEALGVGFRVARVALDRVTQQGRATGDHFNGLGGWVASDLEHLFGGFVAYIGSQGYFFGLD